MFKRKLQFLLLLPALLIVIWPGDSDFRTKESVVPLLEAELMLPEPCKDIQITTVGVVCETEYGFRADLDFPLIDLKSVLAGNEYLPQAEAIFTEDEQIIGSKIYRNLAFSLQWKPVTPDFLQIYIQEYMPYWGNHVPYRLLWTIHYEECSVQNCMEWRLINETGEILPADVEGLDPDLAADSNFNGVPASFWNVNVIP